MPSMHTSTHRLPQSEGLPLQGNAALLLFSSVTVTKAQLANSAVVHFMHLWERRINSFTLTSDTAGAARVTRSLIGA